jgi:hypothetical protein
MTGPDRDELQPAAPAIRTITGADGKVLVFSADRFTADICDGNACFIYGAAPGSKKFNNEHVVPRWVLKRYDLFAKEITLPNGSLQRYGPFTFRSQSVTYVSGIICNPCVRYGP